MLFEIVFVLYASFGWYVFSRWMMFIVQRRLNFEEFVCYIFEALFMSIMYPIILLLSPEYMYDSEIFIVDL